MGTVPRTQVDADELIVLAEWAESKACRVVPAQDAASTTTPDC